ncbi:Importin-beta N-terminal domain [Trinorchestia longiramus]|nr:Importin-beta N-terminal domain [Trinorchestia longiramus]
MDRLEKAADVMMAPPDVVTSEQRHEAEQVFLQLRQTKSPFNLCREILETSQVPYLLFEAASLLRVGIIREWNELTSEDKLQLRQYVLQYVLARPRQPHYVRETLVQVMAIMVKRASVDDGGKERGALIAEVEQLIQNPDNSMRLMGCSVLNALMQEYAVTVKSTDVGITWETHFKAKKQFEGTDLRRIFHFVLGLLKEGAHSLEASGQAGRGEIPDGDLKTTVLRLIMLAEGTLTWTFISLHYILCCYFWSHFILLCSVSLMFEHDQNPPLRPGSQWEQTFKDPSLVQVFFKIYWLVRRDWTLGHHALNCLVQLASLHGVVIVNHAAKTDYIAHFLTCLFSLLSNIEVQECEALGISHIFRKVLQFFPPSILVALPGDLLPSLVDHIASLTCQFAQLSAKEEGTDKEDQMYMEAFEVLLQTWSVVLQETSSRVPYTSFTIVSAAVGLSSPTSSSPNNNNESSNNGNSDLLASLKVKTKQHSTVIFDTYLKSHLAPPEGTRRQLENEEITEAEQSDRVLYMDQLLLIGVCARENVEHCVPILTELLEQRVTMLRSYLGQALQQQQTQQHLIDNLYEDLNWLLLITCNVITTDGDGGDSLVIPPELVLYSIASSPHTDVQATLALLAAPHTMPADMNVPSAVTDKPSIDPVIRLVSCMLRLCETEVEALKANLLQLLSPEVSSTLMWFLKRICATYALLAESNYSELSPALVYAFGRDSEGNAWMLNYLLSCVERTLRLRTAEPALVADTVALLISMAENKTRGQVLVKSKSLIEVVQLQQSGHLAALSSSASRGLMQGLVLMAGAVGSDDGAREEVFQHVLQPVLQSFQTLLDSPDFSKNYQLETNRKQILHHLDNFIGSILGVVRTTASPLFECIAPCLAAMVRLMDLYHNYSEVVESILEVYMEAGRRVLCYLSAAASKQLYEGAVSIVKVYAKHNIGRRTINSEGEKDQWRDLQLLMELLTSLLSKVREAGVGLLNFGLQCTSAKDIAGWSFESLIVDFIDLFPSEDTESEAVAAADVCLYGLNIIMPLMTKELLQIPTLCSHYYKMVLFLAELYPSKILELPSDLLKNLLYSIEIGLTSFGMDVTSYSFDFLYVLASHALKHGGPDSEVLHMLRPFLKLVLDLILSQQVNSDMLQATSASLYVLICAFQSEYQELVNQLIAAQEDPTVKSRLAQAFTHLTDKVQLNGDRVHKFLFRNNFEEFIANVRGFLLVK